MADLQQSHDDTQQSSDESFARVKQTLSSIANDCLDCCLRELDSTSVAPPVSTTSSVIPATTTCAVTPSCFIDCLDYRICGQHNTSGVITTLSQDGSCSQESYCDMETDGGGWTVFQRHQSDAVSFTHRWAEYKNGFGNLSDSFWWGNDKLAQALNDGRRYELRIDLFDWEGEHRYTKYSHFYVALESDNYRIRLSGYTGNAGGDSFGPNANGQQFTTFDQDNDASPDNCAARYGGGFWYLHCGNFLPNGRYSRTSSVPGWTGLHWAHWHGASYSLKAVSMAFRAAN